MDILKQIEEIFNARKLKSEYIEVMKKESISSGGGFEHDFYLLNNGHILSIHYPFMDVEISYNKFKNIDEYIDKDFGFEYEYPNYEKRMFNLLKILKG